jgi:hypothetical protein
LTSYGCTAKKTRGREREKKGQNDLIGPIYVCTVRYFNVLYSGATNILNLENGVTVAFGNKPRRMLKVFHCSKKHCNNHLQGECHRTEETGLL